MNFPETLFVDSDLRAVLENHGNRAVDAIEKYPAEDLIRESEDNLVIHFVEEFRVAAPVLTEGATSVAVDETKVDVSRGGFDRDTFGQSPYFVSGVRVTYHVPFTGEPALFKCQPSVHTLNPPSADVVGQELRFWYERPGSDVGVTKPPFEADLTKVRQYLSWVTSDVNAFNTALTARVRSKVQERRGWLERVRSERDQLGYPVRQEGAGASRAAKPSGPASARRSATATPASTTYDVALSFAGENRPYVERVAKGLQAAGATVFYDEFEKDKLWGKNLVDHLAYVYQHGSRFVVMFISEAYVRKAFPRHERQHAQARALVAQEEYILPARFDDTEVPGLAGTVAYADLRKLLAEELVELILKKLGRAVH